MDIRSATVLAGAASEPRSVARESASSSTSNSASSVGTAPGSEQNSAADTVRTTASGQFYVSPFLTFDSRSLTVIFQVRDTESGDVTRQFPSEAVVERYRRDPSARPFVLPEPEPRDEQQAGPPPPTIGGPVTEALREQEATEPAGSGSPSPETGGGTDTSSAAAPTAQPAIPSASPPGRTSIDLVA